MTSTSTATPSLTATASASTTRPPTSTSITESASAAIAPVGPQETAVNTRSVPRGASSGVIRHGRTTAAERTTRAPNAPVVDRYIADNATEGEVLDNTRTEIRRAGNNASVAQRCLDELRRCVSRSTHERVHATAEMHHAVIRLHARAGDKRAAIDGLCVLRTQAQRHRMRPLATSYLAVIAAHEQDGDDAGVRVWADHLMDDVRSLGVRLDREDYADVISMLARASDARGVERFLNHLLDVGEHAPTLRMYEHVIGSFADAGDAVLASRWTAHLLDHLSDFRLVLTRDDYRALIATLARCRAATGVERAFEHLLDHRDRTDIAPDLGMYHDVMDVMEAVGDAAGVDRWLRHLIDHRDEFRIDADGFCYHAAIAVHAADGNHAAARAWFEDMVAHCRDRPGLRIYNAVIAAHVNDGMFDAAVDLLDRGVRDGVYQPWMGLDRARDLLDFQEYRVVNEPRSRDGLDYVPWQVGVTIHRRHETSDPPMIGPETRFRVGAGTLRDRIRDRIESHRGWRAVCPLDHTGYENPHELISVEDR